MAKKTIRLWKKRGRRLNFRSGPDRLAEKMALLGFSGRCIAETCGLSGPSLVYYRNQQANIRLTDFRNGTSPMAVLVMQRMGGMTGKVLDAHLERQTGAPRPLKVDGVRVRLKTFVRRELVT